MRTLLTFFVFLPFLSFAQVGVNTTTPNAALDIQSTNNGVLIPRVQLTDALDVATVVNPAGGTLATSTLVYNLAPAGAAPNDVVDGFYYWDGARWLPISGAPNWSLNGNTGIVEPNFPITYGTSTIGATENFVGTTDNKDFVVGTNNLERMRVKSTNGNVGIGTANPLQPFHVYKNFNASKSTILGESIQTSTITDFQNRGIEGYGSGTAAGGGYGYGIGVLGIGDRLNSYYATGVLGYLGTTTPNAPSTNQALLANGNNLGNAAILTNGNVGIGIPLGTNPTNQLHVNSAIAGAVRIVDGTQAAGRVLTSTATGVGTWQPPIPSGFTHYLGELYLGGIIFELYKGSDGLEHGLIVSLTESGMLAWQTTNVLVGANRSEDGVFNTALMTSSPAATYIATLGAGWYLPSIDELYLLNNHRYYANKGLRLGGYTLISSTRVYWSSTENDVASARALNINLGTTLLDSKTEPNHVRGIRAF